MAKPSIKRLRLRSLVHKAINDETIKPGKKYLGELALKAGYSPHQSKYHLGEILRRADLVPSFEVTKQQLTEAYVRIAEKAEGLEKFGDSLHALDSLTKLQGHGGQDVNAKVSVDKLLITILNQNSPKEPIKVTDV
jgi:hypothetical protein